MSLSRRNKHHNWGRRPQQHRRCCRLLSHSGNISRFLTCTLHIWHPPHLHLYLNKSSHLFSRQIRCLNHLPNLNQTGSQWHFLRLQKFLNLKGELTRHWHQIMLWQLRNPAPSYLTSRFKLSRSSKNLSQALQQWHQCLNPLYCIQATWLHLSWMQMIL